MPPIRENDDRGPIKFPSSFEMHIAEIFDGLDKNRQTETLKAWRESIKERKEGMQRHKSRSECAD